MSLLRGKRSKSEAQISRVFPTESLRSHPSFDEILWQSSTRYSMAVLTGTALFTATGCWPGRPRCFPTQTSPRTSPQVSLLSLYLSLCAYHTTIPAKVPACFIISTYIDSNLYWYIYIYTRRFFTLLYIMEYCRFCSPYYVLTHHYAHGKLSMAECDE